MKKALLLILMLASLGGGFCIWISGEYTREARPVLDSMTDLQARASAGCSTEEFKQELAVVLSQSEKLSGKWDPVFEERGERPVSYSCLMAARDELEGIRHTMDYRDHFLASQKKAEETFGGTPEFLQYVDSTSKDIRLAEEWLSRDIEDCRVNLAKARECLEKGN